MAGASARAGGAITGINVTPLVDVTLVLLVIFMVTAKLVMQNRALEVDLPKAASGHEVQAILSVELGPGQHLRVDGAPVSSDERLIALTRAARVRTPDVRAVIQADGAVPHRQVVHVLDLMRQAGIVKVGFGVTPGAAATEARDRGR